MRPTNLFNTATFRLALSYASLFALSSAVMFGIVYWAIQEFESEQIRKSIAAEVGSLELSEKADRKDALAKELAERVAYPGQQSFEYALLDAQGKRIAGDLQTLPNQLGWQYVNDTGPVAPDGDQPDVLYVFGQQLDNGRRLFVAKSSESLEELRETVANTFLLSSGVTVALAVLGGLGVSALFVRRIEKLNRTARNVMDGAISARMPVSGSYDEFDRLAVNLNKMLARNESLFGNLKRVSSDIAHDLRTPLTHLRHGLEQAKAEASSVPEFEIVVERSIGEIDGILRTFGALMRISEIESGGQRANFAEFDLSALAATLYQTFAPVAEDDGYRMTSAIEPGILLRGDQAMLTQMIANLCENAMRHTPAGTAITLGVKVQKDTVVCSISDDGPGVPEAERERIFRPFYRLDQSRTTPGSGLGLALVKAIAELHGGTVKLVDAAPGARFEIRLPRSAPLPAILQPAVRLPAILPPLQQLSRNR